MIIILYVLIAIAYRSTKKKQSQDNSSPPLRQQSMQDYMNFQQFLSEKVCAPLLSWLFR